MNWDIFVGICAGFTLVIAAMNVAGGILLVSEGKKTPGVYIIQVIASACATIVAGTVFGWW